MAVEDQALMDLVFMALDHGIGSISDAGGETLIPFLISQDGAGRHLKRFVGDTFEESVALARADVSKLPAHIELVVVAFDGFVTVQDVRSEAVIVQAQRRGTSRSANYAQRYTRQASGIAPLGNAVALGEGDSLF